MILQDLLFLCNILLFSYQIYGEFNNGKVPVQQLASLGGQNLLRGYLSGRYIDNILLAIQPEIKFKITNSLQLALFSGIGNVYENLESINLRKIQLASGVGLRIKVKNNPRINFRIDVAASNQSTGTYFTIMEAFYMLFTIYTLSSPQNILGIFQSKAI